MKKLVLIIMIMSSLVLGEFSSNKATFPKIFIQTEQHELGQIAENGAIVPLSMHIASLKIFDTVVSEFQSTILFAKECRSTAPASDEVGGFDLWILDVNTQKQVQIYPDKNIIKAHLSPDGEKVLMVTRDHTVLLYNCAAHSSRLLSNAAYDGIFAPDGRHLALVRKSSSGYLPIAKMDLVLIDLKTETQTVLKEDFRISNLQWFPSGKRLLFTSAFRTKWASFWIIDISDGSLQQLTNVNMTNYDDFIPVTNGTVHISPNGEKIAYETHYHPYDREIWCLHLDQIETNGLPHATRVADGKLIGWEINGPHVAYLDIQTSQVRVANVNSIPFRKDRRYLQKSLFNLHDNVELETMTLTEDPRFRAPISSVDSDIGYYFDNDKSNPGNEWRTWFCTYGTEAEKYGSYNSHNGTDFSALKGTDIQAAADGTIIYREDGWGDGEAGSNDGGGYGNHVIIDHENGWLTIYAHMIAGSVYQSPVTGVQDPEWKESAEIKVSCSTVIGEVGTSGNSTGPHLHFEVRKDGTPMDPFCGPCSGPTSFWTHRGDGDPITDCKQQLHPSKYGLEVDNSPLPLHMPFRSGTTWQVGGIGSFYGDCHHLDEINDYYAIDWNLVNGNDYGEPVYPVAPGKVIYIGEGTRYDRNDQITLAINHGKFVDVLHTFDSPALGTVKTRYAHLSKVSVSVNQQVFLDTKLGEIGESGNARGPHLHLSFRVYDNSDYVSRYDKEPSRRPSPMVAINGFKLELWNLKDGDKRTVASKQFFQDVPNTVKSGENWSKKWIDAAYAWGIMKETESMPMLFCPSGTISRGKAAKYWVKAKADDPNYEPDPKDYDNPFVDVPSSHPYAGYILKLYHDKKVVGCSEYPKEYCPDRDITRAEMAVFILRALFGVNYTPPEPKGIFDDMPKTGGTDEHWAIEWAEALFELGITGGCLAESGTLNFCPDEFVTRDQMAVFLLRSFNKYPGFYDKDGRGGGETEIPLTWLATISVTNNGEQSTTLTFGQAPDATDAIDNAFDESVLPPVPSIDTFDARFELPIEGDIYSHRDFRPKTSETTWKINFQPGLAGYPVTFSWNPDDLKDGEYYVTDAEIGTSIHENMKTINSYSVSDDRFSTLLIKKTAPNIHVQLPDQLKIPTHFELCQNYPNPFNQCTNINFKVPKSAMITMKIYNTLGREVRTLVDAFYNPGNHTVKWDGLDNFGHNVNSGVYFYYMQSNDFKEVRKALFLK